MAEENDQESAWNSDRVGEGSISYASNSRGARMRDPINLTPKILALLDRHEPDKSKQAKLLTVHLARKNVLPSTEEELQHHLDGRRIGRLTAFWMQQKQKPTNNINSDGQKWHKRQRTLP